MIAELSGRAKSFGACILAITMLEGCLVEAQKPEAANKVVVIVDASGSYQARQIDAVAKATRLLTQIAEAKLHRWEPGTDSITVISLDAMPSVLWQGSLRELQSVDSSMWASLFHSRTDYSCCSDVGAAFRLAARHLQGDPNVIKKFLFGFTDGIDEPPTTSFCSCRPSALPAPPPDGFPWEAFRNVSVSLFWFPANQKLVWSRTAEAKGLENFAIYTDSESDEASIKPPPRPQVVVSDSVRTVERARILRLGTKILKWGVVSFFAVVVLAVGLTLLALRRRRLAHR